VKAVENEEKPTQRVEEIAQEGAVSLGVLKLEPPGSS